MKDFQTAPARMQLMQNGLSYPIESGIPIPSKKNRPEYPFRYMNVGDSFFVPDPNKTLEASVRRNMRHHRGLRFTCRRMTEVGVSGLRVWRIE